MPYANVDEQGQTELKEAMTLTKNKKWYRRLKIIDLSAQGHSVPELASLFDLTGHTIRAYIKAYNEGGLAGLKPGYGQGRLLLLDWSESQWLDLIHQPPKVREKLNSGALNWTQELLQQYFAHYHQLSISQATIAKAIKRARVRWRRAKLSVRSPDPLYLVKRQRVEQLKQKALNGTFPVWMQSTRHQYLMRNQLTSSTSTAPTCLVSRYWSCLSGIGSANQSTFAWL